MVQNANLDTFDDMIKVTQAWVSRFIVRYHLCPFAKPVVDAGLVRYHLTEAKTPEQLLEAFSHELALLLAADPKEVETSFLIHPRVLNDFLDYNDFLDIIDLALEEQGAEGEIQVASFHPHYQFAGTGFEDVENATNRSPYPMLHLIREESLEKALETYPQPEKIPERNIARMKELGAEAIKKIQTECLEVRSEGERESEPLGTE